MSDTTTPNDVVALLKKRGAMQHQEKVETVENDLTTAFADIMYGDDLDVKRRLRDVMSQINDGDTAVLDRIAAGTGTIDDRTALQTLLNSPKLPAGAARAIESIVTEKVKVEADGTITDVKRLTKELEAKPDPAKPAMSAELAKLIGEVKTTTDKLIEQREKLTDLRLALDNTSRIKGNHPLSATAKEAEAFDKAIEAERVLIVKLDELNTKIVAELAKPAS